jgi:hypothetical protein
LSERWQAMILITEQKAQNRAAFLNTCVVR